MSVFGRLLSLVVALLTASNPLAQVREESCPLAYFAYPVDEIEEKTLPRERVSLFALLVDPERYFNRRVSVSGQLMNGHGRTFLVPVSSSDYWFTGDAIRVDNSKIPRCLLEKLDGRPTRVIGTFVPLNHWHILRPVDFVRGIVTGPPDE